MAEHLGITYQLKTSREQRDGSIEVDVEFNRGGVYRYVTFRYTNADQAQSEHHNRCQYKIGNFIAKRETKRTMGEIGDALFKYFTNPANTSLSRSDAVNWYTENVDVQGAI